MSLKNIRVRHKIVDGIINELKEPVAVARQAHQDRAELLKLVDEAKSTIVYLNRQIEGIYGSKSKHANEFLKKLESEVGNEKS